MIDQYNNDFIYKFKKPAIYFIFKSHHKSENVKKIFI